MNLVNVLCEETPRWTQDRYRHWVEIDFDNPHAIAHAKRDEALGLCQWKQVDEQGNLVPYDWPNFT